MNQQWAEVMNKELLTVSEKDGRVGINRLGNSVFYRLQLIFSRVSTTLFINGLCLGKYWRRRHVSAATSTASFRGSPFQSRVHNSCQYHFRKMRLGPLHQKLRSSRMICIICSHSGQKLNQYHHEAIDIDLHIQMTCPNRGM